MRYIWSASVWGRSALSNFICWYKNILTCYNNQITDTIMDTKEFQKELDAVIEWLKREFQTIRTGQAAPAVLDGVSVESYGSQMPIMQVANIGIEGPKSLLVSPYDKNQVKQIEKALVDAGLGLSIVGGDTGVRVIFPDLTAERRDMMVKLAKEKLEQARITARKERDAVWNSIQEQEKVGDISEDDKFTQKEQMENLVKKTNDALEELFKNKEAEIRE